MEELNVSAAAVPENQAGIGETHRHAPKAAGAARGVRAIRYSLHRRRMWRSIPQALPPRFVVHEHKASRFHYDFRLEMGGVLKSWAIPKGPSMNPADKRLAVMVPDHLITYIDLEGLIPEESYGAGSVVVWDSGTYEALESGDLVKQLDTGRIAFALHGEKLQGGFVLTCLARGETGKERLLIKQKDVYANPGWKLQSERTPAQLRKLRAKSPPCETL
jgi:bifunctional non-homologous end joining protein LigD